MLSHMPNCQYCCLSRFNFINNSITAAKYLFNIRFPNLWHNTTLIRELLYSISCLINIIDNSSGSIRVFFCNVSAVFYKIPHCNIRPNNPHKPSRSKIYFLKSECSINFPSAICFSATWISCSNSACSTSSSYALTSRRTAVLRPCCVRIKGRRVSRTWFTNAAALARNSERGLTSSVGRTFGMTSSFYVLHAVQSLVPHFWMPCNSKGRGCANAPAKLRALRYYGRRAASFSLLLDRFL